MLDWNFVGRLRKYDCEVTYGDQTLKWGPGINPWPPPIGGGSPANDAKSPLIAG
jgi:hypothetical protein